MNVTEDSAENSAGTNRRDLFRGAAGIAAVASVGGMMMGPQFASAATPQQVAPPPGAPALPGAPANGLYCEIQRVANSSVDGFKVYSAVWSGQTTAAFSGSTGGSGSIGKATLGSLILTKDSDVNSNALVAAMIQGTVLEEATLFYLKDSVVVQAFILTKVAVVSLGMSNGGDSPFFEELALAYNEIQFENAGAGPFKWSVSENKAVQPS
jgi:type VI protein secretion system component Hcp